jgi:transposase
MAEPARERELLDELWERVRHLLPPRPPAITGRPRVEDKAAFAGVVHILRSGGRWQDLTDTAFPSGSTCWRRHKEWTEAGVWHSVWQVVLAELDAAGGLDVSEVILDGTFVEAKKGGTGRAPARTGRG